MKALIENTWYKGGWLQWLLWPLSWLFIAIAASRRLAFRLGIIKPVALDLPVIIVGNISIGGAGKTPMVLHLIQLCQALGLRPGVVSRGYGGCYQGDYHWVKASDTAQWVGDEPKLIHARTQVPMVVASKRGLAAKLLQDSGLVDVIIADDGLQHYALSRDIELVLVDGERRFGNGLRIPAGPLREGVNRLEEVDAVICNGGKPKPGEFAMQLQAGPLQSLTDSALIDTTQPIVAMAGIGNPQRFADALIGQGYSLEAFYPLSDHQAMEQQTLAPMLAHDRALVMTEKDAVKCNQIQWPEGAQVYWQPVNAQLPREFDELIEQKLRKLLNGI
ncbi:tetraacyldisaccharide 4'-kinase [Paraferrimonas haliotis]|uniref:Tetraacyldisaccharide 4'-kinase n=1 Tax=Paraferrimonas haliotis TaxID=2013866 RepID=A0AA37WYU7_9GAMM|nr:tetraacyldisaccharide 4'-kinase [Paraferrimonas haliotis]GLS84170.1 tetraacyldisaccharide 4'-kinase [Paraferrimonas haliotis]